MATPLSNLQAAYQIASDYYLALTAAISTQGEDLQSYSIEGQSMSRRTVLDKMKMLRQEMADLLVLIQMEAGPYQVHSYGVA